MRRPECGAESHNLPALDALGKERAVLGAAPEGLFKSRDDVSEEDGAASASFLAEISSIYPQILFNHVI